MSPLTLSDPARPVPARAVPEVLLTGAMPVAPLGATAVVYCEGNFGELDGKTANGLVRHSEKYDILSVIDSRHAGADAGTLLDGTANGIIVHRDLGEAIAQLKRVPDYFVYGMAPASGMLSPNERTIVLDANR